jgi:hypothetical protein
MVHPAGKACRFSGGTRMARDPGPRVSAALRHVRDAEHLLQCPTSGTSPDQAYHLAGFGPECARKATWSVDWFDKLAGHRLADAGQFIADIAASLDARAARYHESDWQSRYPALAAWTPECRYDRTGEHARAAAGIVAEARAVTDRLVIALWMDGVHGGGLA